MKAMKKLRAFTLTELLIVMALASLVVGLGGYIYVQFTQIASQHSQRSRLVQSWAVADRYLWLDVQRSEGLRLNERLCVLRGREPGDSTRYLWTEEGLLRQKGGSEVRLGVQVKEWTLDSSGSQPLLRVIVGDSSREMTLSYLLPGHARARE